VKLVIVDYGLGNLYSVERALRFIGTWAVISDKPEDINKADRLILPGVGSFGDGMEGLKKRGLIEPIKEYAASLRPILGVCLGMQLLMTKGEEFGTHRGLGLINGKTISLKALSEDKFSHKLPHIGWNKLLFPGGASFCWENTILEGLKEGSFMYFLHSNVVVPNNPSHCLSDTVYGGITFCSALRMGNIYGCQFHPERSGEAGLEVYKKFVSDKYVESTFIKKGEHDG